MKSVGLVLTSLVLTLCLVSSSAAAVPLMISFLGPEAELILAVVLLPIELALVVLGVTHLLVEFRVGSRRHESPAAGQPHDGDSPIEQGPDGV